MKSETLIAFGDALRARGLLVSPAEVLLAAQALEVLPALERHAMRAVLSATMVKRPGDQPAFAEVFDGFFGLPKLDAESVDDGGNGGTSSAAGQATSRSAASAGRGSSPLDSASTFVARRAAPEPRRSREPTAPRSSDAAGSASESAMPDLHTTGPAPSRTSAARRLVREGADAPVRPGRHDGPGEAPLADTTAKPGPPSRTERDALERRLGIALDGLDLGVLGAKLLEPVGHGDQRRILALLEALLRRFALLPGRRRQPSRRGRLDLRRLFRKNAMHGCEPFLLPRKRVRPRRTKLLLLCDVSGSVRPAAGLMLRLCAGLQARFERSELFVFVDSPRRLDARALSALLPAADELEEPAPRRGRPVWRGGRQRAPRAPGWGWSPAALDDTDLMALSDYGKAFWRLSHSGVIVDRRTVVVVLGDGRTNRFDPLPWAFEEVVGSARGVVWLVPEPRERWGTGDSALAAYAPYCDAVLECTRVGDLVAAASDLARGRVPRRRAPGQRARLPGYPPG